jgi:DNA-binding helix-turn-helix protein
MLYDSFRSNKKINNILNSEQFQYSEQIMEIRIKLNLTIKDIAKILNVTEEYYLDLEYSSLKIPVDEYKHILGKLLDFEKRN